MWEHVTPSFRPRAPDLCHARCRPNPTWSDAMESWFAKWKVTSQHREELLEVESSDDNKRVPRRHGPTTINSEGAPRKGEEEEEDGKSSSGRSTEMGCYWLVGAAREWHWHWHQLHRSIAQAKPARRRHSGQAEIGTILKPEKGVWRKRVRQKLVLWLWGSGGLLNLLRGPNGGLTEPCGGFDRTLLGRSPISGCRFKIPSKRGCYNLGGSLGMAALAQQQKWTQRTREEWHRRPWEEWEEGQAQCHVPWEQQQYPKHEKRRVKRRRTEPEASKSKGSYLPHNATLWPSTQSGSTSTAPMIPMTPGPSLVATAIVKTIPTIEPMPPWDS